MDLARSQFSTAILISIIAFVVVAAVLFISVRNEKRYQARNTDDQH